MKFHSTKLSKQTIGKIPTAETFLIFDERHLKYGEFFFRSHKNIHPNMRIVFEYIQYANAVILFRLKLNEFLLFEMSFILSMHASRATRMLPSVKAFQNGLEREKHHEM